MGAQEFLVCGVTVSLKIVGDIWDNVSTQLNNTYNIGLVVFRHFNAE